MPNIETEEKVDPSISKHEAHWPIQLTVFAALLLQVSLPDKFVAGPRYALPVLEALLLVSLSTVTRKVKIVGAATRKANAIGLILLISVANIYALQSLSHELLAGGAVSDGRSLVRAAINIYLTNIIVFGLLYWELDGGGPLKRAWNSVHNRDFLFPQMATPQFGPTRWLPTFTDYLYVSATNATAFSPTDTMPLTRRAKAFMLVQSLVSLTTLGLVAARAVNILK
jgi:hypothetical protein